MKPINPPPTSEKFNFQRNGSILKQEGKKLNFKERERAKKPIKNRCFHMWPEKESIRLSLVGLDKEIGRI